VLANLVPVWAPLSVSRWFPAARGARSGPVPAYPVAHGPAPRAPQA